MIKRISFALLVIATFSSCHSSSTKESASTGSSTTTTSPPPTFERNPEKRDQVKKEPVAEYQVKTNDKLNDQYFSVRIYETPITMKYLAKVEFEGLTGEDTIKLPDMGIPPQPELQKGPEEYSCIIGLIDNNKKFRELKKVYVTEKGREFKITKLKHYIVTEDYKLVDQ